MEEDLAGPSVRVGWTVVRPVATAGGGVDHLAILVPATRTGRRRRGVGPARSLASRRWQRGGNAVDASDAPLDVPVVLTLYSSSFCGACAQTRRAIEDAAGLLGDRVTVREVNVADDPEESERRDIVATPTTVLTAPDGTELARAAGVPSAPQVLTLLAKHLEPGARSQEVSTSAGRIGPFLPAEADGSC